MTDRTLRADGETARLGPVVAVNNTWNRRELENGVDYVQTIELGEAVVMRWDWPDAPAGVRAFPELYAGRKPWGGPAGGDDLPAPLADARELAVRYDAAPSGAPGGFRVAFDLWVSADPAGGPAAITHEIMVHLTSAAAPPAGAPVGRLELGPFSGVLWRREDMGRGGWTYLALVPDDAPLAGRLELAPLLDALALPPEAWLMTVELGAEVVAGAGALTLRDFAVVPAATEARVGIPAPVPLAADGP